MSYDCSRGRRSFLKLIFGLVAGLGAVCIDAVNMMARSRRFKRAARAEIPAASVKKIKPGTAVHFPGARAWITIDRDGKPVAFDERCPHRRCKFEWIAASKGFECPCHGSKFSSDGNVIQGPAPRPLTSLKIETVGDGNLRLLD